MSFTVSVGEANFAALRKEKAYYVDKTEIIYELVHDTKNKVSLFTRPRRFGKTLMLSMMENFFDIRKDSRTMFKDLAVSRHEEFCREWMNQFPVLSVSFKDIEAEDFDGAYEMLQARLADLCKNMAYLLDADRVDADDKVLFRRIKSESGKRSDVKNSLKILTRMLYAVYGKPVILLIDEYDVPLAMAGEKDTKGNEYYRSMLDVIRGILGTALKDNEFLQFAVVSGCLRVAKESIFTGTNNFSSYSVLDEDFSGYFGFSEEDIASMLEAAGHSEKAEMIKEWYDGYLFGNNRLYCPWDVINYLSALIKRENAVPKNYWKNTSHNGILLTFAKRTDFNINGKFEILMNGGSIIQSIKDDLTYDTLHSSEDKLWSVLLMTGYLTKARAGEEGETVHLKIPNREIMGIFEEAVARLFEDNLDSSIQKTMMEAFWNSEEKKAGKAISSLLWKTISYNDYHEDYYHAFLSGIFTGLGYEIQSNKETGLGRPDILLKDTARRRAIIIEAKRSGKKSDLDRDCGKALNQIQERRYADGLYGYEQIICCGIAFFQKEAKVKFIKYGVNYA